MDLIVTQSVNENGISIFVTFLLAIIGYAGLTAVLLLSLKGKIPFLLWRTVALIIFLHVIMVWTFRYDWQFSLAVRNGYGGFFIFHSALILILISAFIKSPLALLLIYLSFFAVSAGALGAVFRYDVVEIYKIPVIIFSIIGSSGIFWKYVFQRRKNIKASLK